MIPFHSYFTLKDCYRFLCLFSLFLLFLLLKPDLLMDREAFIKADPMVTPSSIKPEWYFLFFYAILRSGERKSEGLLLVLLFLGLL